MTDAMDGVSLANTKAQWNEALQGAVGAFRLLVSQSNAKAWKPVVSPNQAGSFPSSSSTSGPSVSRPIPATPNGSVALREKQVSEHRRASTVLSSSHESGIQQSLSSSPSASTIHANLADGSNTAAEGATAFPSRNIPFAPKLITDPSAVKIHRRSGGKAVGLPSGVDVHRAVVDVPFEGTADLEAFKASLSTPEARTKWDSMVDSAETIEILDPQTQVAKTKFKLGWPASPRDAITISRTISDANTLIFVSTSLPRSADAPAYLRPAPPFVRSHVHLFAWCIQLPTEDSQHQQSFRMTVFHAWDLRGAWLGMPPGGLATHLTSTTKGLIKFIRKGSAALPSLRTWGTTFDVLTSSFDLSRDTLSVEYCVTADEVENSKDAASDENLRKNLGNSIQFALPAEEGWDVKLSVKPQFVNDESSAAWTAAAFRHKSAATPAQSPQLTLQINHARLEASDESLRAQITIQRIAASSDIRLRINDETYQIEDRESAEDVSSPAPPVSPLLRETATLSDISVHGSNAADASQEVGRHKVTDSVSQFSTPKRNAAIGPVVRRNYIYFTSMLQEPDAKWKHLSDSRGVTVTQLDSIDPTLVVYRAEATFVNVGVWDIFASISSPGTRPYWDKSLDEAKLLEDVGNVSTLWHTKTKAAWPASPRDAVEIETSYKSPSSVHIFSFSTDDRKLFPSITSPALGTIRTQVDLRGWSVESLSPTTVHVTLIEQSDPKGWTSKSATPAAMIAAVAGVGEHAIKMGAPPVLTRILDATVSDLKYDAEKATFRLEYSRSQSADGEGDDDDVAPASTDTHNVECELRCDLESWAANLDLVVDPPPINVSCLRRHKLSPGGGGLWITIEHVPASLEDDAARVTVRRGAVATPGERGVVLVNGAKIRVDVDELKENEVAQLKDRKRSKPQRVPLDMRQKPKKDSAASSLGTSAISVPGQPSLPSTPDMSGAASISSVPSRVGSPAPPEMASTPKRGTPFSDKQPKHAMTPALDVLFLLRRIYAERSPDPAVTPAGWALVSQRSGLYVRKKLMQSISPTIAVQRGDKVVQGVTAEDMVAAVSSLGCRKQWDERVETSKILQSYSDGATTSFFTTSGAFPFRGRGFYLASLTSRAAPPSSRPDDSLGSPTSSLGAQNVYYHAAASFPERASELDGNQVNPTGLPIGTVLMDGWIFETLDPYSSTLNYQIPSTRCTHIVAIDYAGSLPAAVNTIWNVNLPRAILAVENYVKSQGAVPSVRAPPAFVQVLGGGRDEDHDYVWSLSDGSVKRQSSLLYSNFSAPERRLEVLLHVKKQQPSKTAGLPASSSSNTITPVASRFLRTPTVSNASTTKASAQAAVSSTSRSQSLQDSLAEAGNGGAPQIQGLDSSTIKNGSVGRSTAKNPSSLLAPGFQSSLRAPRVSLRGSDLRPKRPVVLGDVEIELKHYTAGYKVEIYTEFVKPKPAGAERETTPPDIKTDDQTEGAPSASKPITSSTTSPLPPIPLDTIAKSRKDVPVVVTVYDLPPSAVLAATLDPSARPRRHLLRLTLPENADDDQGDDGAADGGDEDAKKAPWKDRLALQDACVRIVVRPVRAEASASSAASKGNASVDVNAAFASGEQSDAQGTGAADTEDIDSQQVPVHYGGQKLDIVHVNKTSSMLQREHSIEAGISVLQRIPPGAARDTVDGDTATESSEDLMIPRALARPVATASLLQRKPDPPPIAAKTAGQSVGVADSKGASGDKDKDKSVPSGGDGTSQAEAKVQGGSASTSTDDKKDSGASSAATSLMGLLQSYPLSRLGASTALSTVSATGEGTRRRENGTKGGEGAKSGTDAGDGAKDAVTSTASQLTSILPDNPAVLLGGHTLHDARFSLATLMVVALICFLAGSLLRAMLSPADFIFFAPAGADGKGTSAMASDAAGAAVSEIHRLLNGGGGGDGSSLVAKTALTEAVAWRKVLRLLEIKRAVAGRFDLVLAIVDRRLL